MTRIPFHRDGCRWGGGSGPMGQAPGASSDDVETVVVRGLLQRQPTSELAIALTTMVAEVADAVEAEADPLCMDVWDDKPVIEALRAGDAASGGAMGLRRVARRAARYRWDGVQLLLLVHGGRARVCPPPAARLALAEATHKVGHYGVKRTLALLRAGHWCSRWR
ncbi:hypothetical protein Agub_g7871 [Astrephomene gubernaculifera]|uniref:Integrase zinc-binding domain-containing protein n=1 Tax=Astrephomene gubernaculifera TaxID=47775 RepID=A0AAD3DSP2_9CHLO|nr:hypothetical protein Agub_g7871 [Astrephomene gubernaculifera]